MKKFGTFLCERKVSKMTSPVLMKQFYHGNYLNHVEVTHMNCAPTVITLLMASKNAQKLDKVVRVTVAASPPTAAMFEKMFDYNLHPVHVYGMVSFNGGNPP